MDLVKLTIAEIFQKLIRNLNEKIVLHIFFKQLIYIVNYIIPAIHNVILHQIRSINKESTAI